MRQQLVPHYSIRAPLTLSEASGALDVRGAHCANSLQRAKRRPALVRKIEGV